MANYCCAIFFFTLAMKQSGPARRFPPPWSVDGQGLVMRTPAQLEKWRAIRIHRIEHLLRIRCSFCGAPAGEPCRTKAGREILSTGEMHDARITPTRAHKRYRP